MPNTNDDKPSVNSLVLLYATREGQTLRIVEHMQRCLQQAKVPVRILALDACHDWPCQRHEMAVICSPVRYGKHLPAAQRFVKKFGKHLDDKPSAMVSVNLTARKPERSTPNNNPYLKRFLNQNGWQPVLQAVFAGALEYERYPWWDRLMIRTIMRMTKGPTTGGQKYEFTNWSAVEHFCDQLVMLLEEKA
ncbi:menaquinone-dependent protoporphyrinogen IX dehydrogenase [Aestuariirhabdus sp. Z084]|uniref:menaquinone-dependent protoporphyrinogen IX dehydrogenase n=1 Tax=Aestuariirhabdus haliotis TaxID=2918751 RepID=UPI00201B44F1|nr:menaquinone-dependent protoporphyrinogen IX dehydrogenase [Aestuariirhabdus haliotis]MCL6416765.1 menaquinone-dependent protoporphyrinogen IX dehydrogenase [Aestuariirhabdus haliotis]MCL6420770.1 menaquinone-dependent protoporphyrinogen IX dehydrogenase [Aestuariirhabdus haliotis]